MGAALRFLGCSKERLDAYLNGCDEVFPLPNGYAVRKGAVMHILAPQKSLSGRKLLRECERVITLVHQHTKVIQAPVKKTDNKAKKFVKFLGFEEGKEDETHVWFYHRSMLCSA